MKIPEDGETRRSYCPICGTETTHVYHVVHIGFGEERFWKCLGCGKEK